MADLRDLSRKDGILRIITFTKHTIYEKLEIILYDRVMCSYHIAR